MSMPDPEAAHDRSDAGDEEEEQANKAEPEPEIEQDVMGVRRCLQLLESGLVELELHSQAIANEEMMRNQLFRLRSEVQAVLGRLRLSHTVERVLVRRSQWNPNGVPVGGG